MILSRCIFFLLLLVNIQLTFGQSAQLKNQLLEDIIKKMSLEEKVGQMVNLTLSTISKEKDNPITLDSAKLRKVLVEWHTGALQNVIKHAYSVEEWHKIIKTIQDISLKETRIKIPNLYCIDAMHGATFTLGATLFPQNLGMAATRNPELVKTAAQITAKEVRASGIRYDFSPVLDIGRQPLWPRFAETFGEDVLLVKTFGTAAVKGLENAALSDPNAVASCMKHFVAYSAPNNGRDRATASVPEREVREYYLPSFKAAVEAGSKTIMVNSAELNGVPLHASKYWLTTVLRNELAFKGLIISDWEDIKKMHQRHRVADSFKEAARLAVEAGIDMCIVPFDSSFYFHVVELVKEGKISEARINESVKRILQLKKELGLFDNAYPEPAASKNFGLKDYATTALQAARESVTLLKNDNNKLPLSKTSKILVTGPAARSLSSLHGCWSYTWQGDTSAYFPASTMTIEQAIIKKIGGANVKYTKGSGFEEGYWGDEALAASKEVDAIVVCLGEESYAETPGNIKDLEIAEVQTRLVQQLAQSGKPVIVVLTQGRPRLIRKLEPSSNGILLAYWPGSKGADAIADVLFGDYNPEGKLPFTYPKFSGDINTYDHKPLDVAVEIADPYKYYYDFDPQYPFGFGLSYTKFDYSDLTLSDTLLQDGKILKVKVNVKNSGKIAGKEVVELYTRDLFASITPAVKQLKGFKKISLEAGTSATVEFEVRKEDLSFINDQLKSVTEPGGFQVIVKELRKSFTYK